MRTLKAVRALFHPGQVVRVVQNTKRPELDGTLRLLTKVGAGVMEATVLTGPGEGKTGFRMTLPTLVRDVVSVDATTVSYRFGDGQHTLTLSSVGAAPDAATLRSRVATPAELAATSTVEVASDGPYAILDGQRLIAIADDYATIHWTADGVSTTDAEAAHAMISDAAAASPPPTTTVRVRLTSADLPGMPIGAAGTVARRGDWPPLVRFDLDGSERAVPDDALAVQRGRLIVVEGPAGVGTTRTAEALRDALALHVPVRLVCEPVGRDRALALVDDVVKPLLAGGAWVVVDRPAVRSLAHGVVDDQLGVGEAVRDCVSRHAACMSTARCCSTSLPGSRRTGGAARPRGRTGCRTPASSSWLRRRCTAGSPRRGRSGLSRSTPTIPCTVSPRPWPRRSTTCCGRRATSCA